MEKIKIIYLVQTKKAAQLRAALNSKKNIKFK